MKKKLSLLLLIFILFACNDSPRNTELKGRATESSKSSVTELSAKELPKVGITPHANQCKEGEALLFAGETFMSYTEDRIRGEGVVSFTMNINDRLTILNEDESDFGEIILNEDMSYFTLTMPRKVIARRLIVNSDFATYDFDAENIDVDKDYLFIYVNKKKRKVKKSDLKFTFSTWKDYIKEHFLKLKDCNLLTDVNGKTNLKSEGLAFVVTEVKGDEIKIKSTRDCLSEDKSFKDLEGSVKWKTGNALLIDFALCE